MTRRTTDTMPDRAEREALASCAVTLNGNRAHISGIGCDYARVSDAQTGLSAQWSWFAVRHIVRNRGGRFKS